MKGFVIAVTVPQPSFFESLLTAGHTKILQNLFLEGLSPPQTFSPTLFALFPVYYLIK